MKKIELISATRVALALGSLAIGFSAIALNSKFSAIKPGTMIRDTSDIDQQLADQAEYFVRDQRALGISDEEILANFEKSEPREGRDDMVSEDRDSVRLAREAQVRKAVGAILADGIRSIR